MKEFNNGYFSVLVAFVVKHTLRNRDSGWSEYENANIWGFLLRLRRPFYGILSPKLHIINAVKLIRIPNTFDTITPEMAKPPRKISKFQDFQNYFGRFWIIEIENSDFQIGFENPEILKFFDKIFGPSR